MQASLSTAALLLAGAAVLAGCSSTPLSEPSSGSTTTTGSSTATPPAGGGTGKPVASSTVTSVMLAPHLDPKNRISSERSVFFDFDDFSIRSDYSALVERHGRYLQSKPALAIKIEGNADERGSPEYNLALGQKRAEAVAQALRIYGVKESQMEPVSWGEERPRATGHDEAAWAQNRRADLVYPRQ
ncbi:MAG: peptidoglycan-associated lipoprotein Pal [Piscinibacter sp.]|nr:peptidoglycan-associated lipoprotein Pal [Piscinibacter sp.]